MLLVNTPRYIKRSRSPSMMEKIASSLRQLLVKLDSWLSPDKSEELPRRNDEAGFYWTTRPVKVWVSQLPRRSWIVLPNDVKVE